jgi:pimeloyl-ACP methyl ester carboxylesterase
VTESDTLGLRVGGVRLPEPVVGTTHVGPHSASWLSWGDAARPTIVLLHGGAAHACWWWFTAALLHDDFHVVALDLSGHGSSDWRPEYTYAAWVEEVIAVALPDERARPVVVGHSMGGMVAGVAAGHDQARRFAGIVVVDHAPVVALGDERYQRSEEQFSTVRSYPDVDSAVAAFRLRPPQPLVIGDFFDLVAQRSVRRDTTNGSWTWHYDPRAFGAKEDRPTTTVPQLLQASCPVMAVVGERSSIITAEDLAALRDLEVATAGKVALRVLQGAAHHPMFDAPWVLADIIRTCAMRWTVAVDPT